MEVHEDYIFYVYLQNFYDETECVYKLQVNIYDEQIPGQ